MIPEPAITRAPLRDMLEIVKSAGPEYMQAFGRELIEREVAVALYDQDARLARNFARSGFFGDITGTTADQAIAQAMTKIQLGRSWNMDPASAMKHLFFVNGKPAIENEYLASKMRDSGLSWEIDWQRDAAGVCIGCVLWPSRWVPDETGKSGTWDPIKERVNGQSVAASVSFTKEDADRIKIKEGGQWIPLSQKSTYISFFQDMVFWRAIARLRRRYATNVLSGVFTREEAEEIEPVQQQRSLPAPKPMNAPAAEMAPAREAKTRAPKAIVEVPVAQPVLTVVAEPVTVTVPTPTAVVAEVTVPVVTEQSPAVSAAPAFDRNAVIVELRELRAKAEKIGEGLFVAWLNEVNPDLNTPVLDLSDADLQEHLGWLKAQSEKKWRKNKDGAWVKGLF